MPISAPLHYKCLTLNIYFPHKRYTHHPDHKVGEDGDPDGGEDEGDHEEFLPARFGTVRDG